MASLSSQCICLKKFLISHSSKPLLNLFFNQFPLAELESKPFHQTNHRSHSTTTALLKQINSPFAYQIGFPLGIGKATDLSRKNSLDVFCEIDPFAFSIDKVIDFPLDIGKATDLSRKSSLDVFCEMDPFALSLDEVIGFPLGTAKRQVFRAKVPWTFSVRWIHSPLVSIQR